MKIAVLGTGSAGQKHLRAMNALDGVEPIAVPLRAARMAELESQGFAAAQDLASAVAMGASAAVIATETARHPQDAISALEAGLDVLVEKPLAVNALQALKVPERATQLGRKGYVGCLLRFSQSLNTFKEHLETVGLLHSVRIECRSYLPDWQTGRPYSATFRARPIEGGVLLDLIHEIDYAGWLFQWPDSIQARVKNLGRLGIDADEIADLAWETPTGCSVSVGLDFLSRPPSRGIIASGENGSIQWDGLTGKVLVQLKDAPDQNIITKQSVDEMFLAQMAAFVAAITGRPGKTSASLEDGVNALAICDAARLASDSRHKEPVEYPWPVAALS